MNQNLAVSDPTGVDLKLGEQYTWHFCWFNFLWPIVLPEDWITENRAGDSAGRCLDGSERFKFTLLLLFITQL